MELKDYIRVIPDFPQQGIRFKDITTLLQNGEALRTAVKQLADWSKQQGAQVIVGPEARGFLFGTPVAYELGVGFVPIRKPGKLPGEVVECKYELEYGSDCLQIHKDSLTPGQKVVILDDLLATGGTINTTIELVERLGAQVVGLGFLIELTYLNGREKLKGYDVHSLIKY
ncbi:MAG TPA: adenine phosphoribosyltransferase [Candidatus Deferrimicrobium sp.]|jgi:adenine phosphoribosyltransferase|nr:adenine phosphoribosyltransferase [Candidatus Deferrimicrobium sp.]